VSSLIFATKIKMDQIM